MTIYPVMTSEKTEIQAGKLYLEFVPRKLSRGERSSDIKTRVPHRISIQIL